MNFERGQGVKESIGIGIDARIKEVGGIILREDDFIRGWKGRWPNKKSMPDINDVKGDFGKVWSYTVVIAIIGQRYKILKHRYGISGGKRLEEGDIKDLGPIIDSIIKEINEPISFPNFNNVVFSPVANYVVPVLPMTAPSSGLFLSLDYKYKKNIFTKISDVFRKRTRP